MTQSGHQRLRTAAVQTEPQPQGARAGRRTNYLLNLYHLLVLDRRFYLLSQLRRNVVYAMGGLGMFGSLLHHFILGRAARNEITALH